MLSVTIKANDTDDAIEIMQERGIACAYLTNADDRYYQYTFRLLDTHEALVRDWFAEHPVLVPGFGYPNGTCLHYSVRLPDEQAAVEYPQGWRVVPT